MRAFTLVELMVVILIFSIIAAAVFGVLSMGRKAWHNGTTQVELQQETRRAMDRMVKELRQSSATRIATSFSGDSIVFQVPVDWDNDGDVDVGGNIEWGAEDNLGWAIQYLLGGLNNQQLLRRVLEAFPVGNPVQQDTTLANNIDSNNPPPNALKFITSPRMVDIEITAQKETALGRRIESNLHSQVNLRNYPQYGLSN